MAHARIRSDIKMFCIIQTDRGPLPRKHYDRSFQAFTMEGRDEYNTLIVIDRKAYWVNSIDLEFI